MDRGSGRCWPGPAPPPGTEASPSCTRRGEGPRAASGPRARRGSLHPAPPNSAPPTLTGFPRPRPLQQPLRGPHVLRLHSLHQLLLLPHGAAGAAATLLRSVRSARLRSNGGSPAAPAASSSSATAFPPPAPLAVLRLRLGLQARMGRGARHGRGAARRRGPAAGARRGRGTWHRLRDAWVPLWWLLTSVRPPHRPRARLLGSAPTSGRVLPRRPLPTCGPRGSGPAYANTPLPRSTGD